MEPLMIIDGARILTEVGSSGLVYASSPDVPGLNVAARSMDALPAAVSAALAALREEASTAPSRSR